jgi:hypothetical protein
MTSGLTTRAVRFRELNEAGRLLLPNAWDAASARVLRGGGVSCNRHNQRRHRVRRGLSRRRTHPP